MDVKVMDISTLTFTSAMKHKNELYSIVLGKDGNPKLVPLSLDAPGNSVLLKITMDNATKFQTVSDEEVEIDPPVDKKRDKPIKVWERLTYKFDGYSENEIIKVESRPNGSIRVSFNEKADAEKYREYFRDHFYASTNHADAVSITSIYQELKLVNKDGEPKFDVVECRRWGYPSIDHGPCTYISEVSKTIGCAMYGFTLKRPQKLYGITAANAN